MLLQAQPIILKQKGELQVNLRNGSLSLLLLSWPRYIALYSSVEHSELYPFIHRYTSNLNSKEISLSNRSLFSLLEGLNTQILSHIISIYTLLDTHKIH